MNLWNYSLKLSTNVYWEKKPFFKMKEDTYDTWVMFSTESGRFKYKIGNEEGIIQPYEIIFCPPGFTFEREAITPMALHFAGFHFEPDPRGDFETFLPTFKVQPTDRNRVSSNLTYLKLLHLEMDERSLARKQLIINDLWQLACHEYDMVLGKDTMATVTQTSDPDMKWAVDWLIEHAYTIFNIRDLSDEVGLSPAQFSRRFKKAFRMSPSELVRTLRIKKAARLLLDTDLTLDEIAQQCGYDNGFYLSRIFTQQMKIAPSKYRKENQV